MAEHDNKAKNQNQFKGNAFIKNTAINGVTVQYLEFVLKHNDYVSVRD